MGKQGVYRRILRSLRVRTNQADNSSVRIVGWGEGVNLPLESKVDTRGEPYMKNILVMPTGVLAPRTSDNLNQLHAYVRRHYKTKNIFDRRTKAWRYLKSHDSEAERLSQRLNQTVSDNGHARTLQDHPSKTNDGGSDGDSK